MSIRKNTIALLSAALFGSLAFAGTIGGVAEPETPGSLGPQAAAEARHNALVHGIDNTARQPIAQAPGSEQAQGVAEQQHLKLQHGQVNDSADRRMLRDASRL